MSRRADGGIEPETAAGDGAPYRIGLISDTHGTLSLEALHAFEGVDEIIHAGDIGGPDVLRELQSVAPVTAVLGNTDHDDIPSWDVDALARLTRSGLTIVVVHDRHALGPVPDDVDIVVAGHTHRTMNVETDGVLWVNPGSASRSRGDGRTVAVLELEDASASVRFVPIG